jgi:hypothetical protein
MYRVETERFPTRKENIMTTKTATLIGSAVGLTTFLAIGLLPAMLYGGYSGLLLAGGILGTPVTATLAARAFIVGGMVFGVTGVASLFAVVGAVAGAAINALLRLPRRISAKG